MKNILKFCLLVWITFTACDVSREKMITGRWKTEHLLILNWDRYEEEMKKIAEANIEKTIQKEYDNAEDKDLYAAGMDETRKKSLENFRVKFNEARKSLHEGIKNSITEYRADGTSETRTGETVTDNGTWILGEEGAVLTETNRFGKKIVSKIISFQDDKMELETILKLRDTMSDEEAAGYDGNNLSPLLDYELRFNKIMRKSRRNS
ncbi:MAG: hypothetical protein JXA03_08270 [Bacteroidales bacterium]|nr:hypothetical protein [Bacteroidales bacterium]